MLAKNVYNELINDKHHVHMNATKWLTLTEFVKHLGRTGQCKVCESVWARACMCVARRYGVDKGGAGIAGGVRVWQEAHGPTSPNTKVGETRQGWLMTPTQRDTPPPPAL